MSPSGKIFEVTSSRLSLPLLSERPTGKAYVAQHGDAITPWSSEPDACPHTQGTDSQYTVDELDAWYDEFNGGGGSSNPMPIRNQIAVASLAKTKDFYTTFFPSLEVTHADGDSDSCKSMSLSMEAYTTQGYKVETRFVENHADAAGDKALTDFVDYIEAQHDEYTEPNKGWDAWYDRHLGIMCNKCSLDTYMTKFFKNDVSFLPHGRDSVTDNTGVPTQHCWTEGVQGYGLEMQGFYDFSFRDCYTVFDWCKADTSGAEFCASS